MKHITLVLKGYPRLSETFIAQEIYALEQRGYALNIVSLRHPTDTRRHPVHDLIQAPVNYLPEYLHQEPIRVLAALAHCLVRRHVFRALKPFWRDFLRDRSRNRIRRFGQAAVLAREAGATAEIFYAHFAHTPASVTRYAAALRGLPWSCSAHAKDIWTSPEWELREKLESLQWLVTCTRANVDYLSTLAPSPHTVQLVYHGIDQNRFGEPPTREHAPSDGTNPHHPVRIISVGRAVPKKGYDDVLEALAALPPELHWRFEHIGGGELLEDLKARAEQLGIAAKIQWSGSQPQPEVLQAYRAADIFVLASRITDDGDRDGLPNVLMEAQTQGLCCVSTDISGIPELIQSGKTGVLIQSGDVADLSEQLRLLILDPARRQQLALAGRERVSSVFDMHRGIDQLVELFGAPTP